MSAKFHLEEILQLLNINKSENKNVNDYTSTLFYGINLNILWFVESHKELLAYLRVAKATPLISQQLPLLFAVSSCQ